MKLYRYEAQSYSNNKVSIDLIEFEVDKETNKSYIIYKLADYGKRTSISKTSIKKYAYPTKEEALTSLKARRKVQLKILQNKLRLCELTNNYLNNASVKSIDESPEFNYYNIDKILDKILEKSL